MSVSWPSAVAWLWRPRPAVAWPWRRQPAGDAPGLQLRLLVVIALASVAIAGADAVSLRAAHDQAIHAAEAEVTNLSRSLADQAHDVFQLMDVVLVGLRERVRTEGTGPEARDRMQRVMADHLQLLPLLHRLMVTDVHGKIIMASGMSFPQGNLSESFCFRHFMSQRDQGALLGPPMRDTADGTWNIPIARRYSYADGSFAGIVMAFVSTAYFRQSYAGLDIGKGGLLLLESREGRVMARWPADPRGEAADVSGTETFRQISRPDPPKTFDVVSQADHIERLDGYSPVSGWPAFLVVGRARQEILASWRTTLALHVVGLLGVLGIIGLRGHGLARAIGELARARALLLETNERLAASEARIGRANRWMALAEQIACIGHWHLTVGENPRLVWSDEMYRIHGQEPDKFTPSADEVMRHYHRQDQVEVATAVAEAILHGTPFEYTARVIRPDGTLRYVFNRGMSQRDEDDTTVAVFGVAMDITEQRHNEAALREAHAQAEAANRALAEANNALKTLALQDALTGLANRRQFDSTLESEFRRAMRGSSSLALIMIDVDMFKSFNDTYGHRAGDACLRAIATLIATLLTRPGDSAARYGGEELAVLLPCTGQDEAKEIAARLAAGVRGLAIPHAGSPRGIVTISAGVEAFVPIAGQDTAARLVEHADRALYAAKSAGRDKVVAYGDARLLLWEAVRARA